MKEVRQCPLCEWKHEAPSLQSVAEQYGSANIMAGLAIHQRAIDIDRALGAHFTAHTTAEWARALFNSQAEVDRLRSALEIIADHATHRGVLWAAQTAYHVICNTPSPPPAHPEAFLDDGFGNVWQKCQPFDKCRMQIVRPGKMQCDCTDHKSEAAHK